MKVWLAEGFVKKLYQDNKEKVDFLNEDYLFAVRFNDQIRFDSWGKTAAYFPWQRGFETPNWDGIRGFEISLKGRKQALWQACKWMSADCHSGGQCNTRKAVLNRTARQMYYIMRKRGEFLSDSWHNTVYYEMAVTLAAEIKEMA